MILLGIVSLTVNLGSKISPPVFWGSWMVGAQVTGIRDNEVHKQQFQEGVINFQVLLLEPGSTPALDIYS